MPSASLLFWKGTWASLPFVLVALPFGMLFGVMATEAGLNLTQAMAMTVVVLAGASQFAALSLYVEQAPALMCILIGLAVNSRMAMYSAALVPHLGKAAVWQRALVAYSLVDQAFILSDQEYQQNPDWPIRHKLAYYAGSTCLICMVWIGASLIGAVLGNALPEWVALDFAMPIAFLAMVAPALRTVPHLVAAGTSIVLALAFVAVPFGLGLLLAALCAMAVGAELERRISAP